MLLHPSIPGLYYYYFHARTASVTGDGACLGGGVCLVMLRTRFSFIHWYHRPSPLSPSRPVPFRQPARQWFMCTLLLPCSSCIASLGAAAILLCISPLHDIHSDLDWRLFLHTGIFEYKYIMWPWEPKLCCQLPECLAATRDDVTRKVLVDWETVV